MPVMASSTSVHAEGKVRTSCHLHQEKGRGWLTINAGDVGVSFHLDLAAAESLADAFAMIERMIRDQINCPVDDDAVGEDGCDLSNLPPYNRGA